MFNKKLIFTFTFLVTLIAQQLEGSQIHQKLNSATTVQNQSQEALIGKRIESKPVPQYFKFKQEQTRTFEKLPNDTKFIIGEFIGFDTKKEGSCLNPLQYHINKYDSNAVQLLVALQAHKHEPKVKFDHEKSTPLHDTIVRYRLTLDHVDHSLPWRKKANTEYLGIIDFFLRKKVVDINKTIQNKETPIHMAVSYNLPNITQRLIRANADLSLKNEWDETPLDMARKEAMRPIKTNYRKKAYAICTMLKQAGAPSSITLEPMPSDDVMDQQDRAASEKQNNWMKR